MIEIRSFIDTYLFHSIIASYGLLLLIIIYYNLELLLLFPRLK